MDVSIILVNYNTKDLTLNCLNSIYEKTEDIEFDIFVVDNASNDGSCEAVKKAFPNVKLISNNENIGFGRANNIAINQSNAKYVFLLNTDTILINNAVKILFALLEANSKAGACGGNLFDLNMKPVHSYGFFNSPKRQLLRLLGMRYFLKNIKNDANRDELQEVEQIIGADLMIRKDVLDQIGIFNEKFFLYYEESELQFRIRKAGFNILYCPDAQIFHLEGASTKKNKKLRRQMIMQSEYLYFTLCYDSHKFLLRILCTLPNLYRFISAPKHTAKALKYIWKN